MAKKQRGAGDDNLPSREQIIEFLESAPGNAGKREIARAFGIKGSARIALKARLREMKAEGLIEKRGSHLHKPGELPPVTVLEIIRRDSDGDLIGIPNDWDEGHGRPPELVVTQARNARESAPGIGDLVLARIAEGGRAPNDTHTARIIKVINRKPATAIGIFRGLPGGGGRVEPVDKRQLKSFAIAPNARNGAEEGDLVTIEPIRGRPMGLPQAKVKTVLAEQSTEYALSEIAIHRHDIPSVFPEAVLREAKEAKQAGNDHREDLTALPLVTIDPADAKDHDDAVYAEPDPEHEGGFILWVAIADVSWYVRPGDAMDREARKRGNSVYFPDRVVPMLPERISNDLCSLREKELRPALVARIRIDSAGRKHEHKFIRANIRSAAKLAYPQAQAAIDGKPDAKTEPLLESVLRPLWRAYEVLAKARDNRGPLALDLPERKILLKPDGHVDRVFIPPRLDAHRLIEEFMIIANVAAAESLEKRKAPGLYRVHDQPSDVKIASLSDFLSSIGEKLPKDGVLRPSHFNAILDRIKGTPNETLVNEVILRSQAQAEYSAQNYGHFGLNLRSYAHFTSPIRRYADLVVHRALIETLGLGPGGQIIDDAAELDEIAAEISAAERRAMAAERETVDRLIAHFVSESVGATFAATISGVTRSGLFLKLDDTGADGFVPASTIGGDYWVHDDVHQRLIGERTRGVYQLGDRVDARLVEAIPMAGALRFELLTPARLDKGARPPARGRAGARRKAAPGRPTGARGRRK